MSTHIATSAAAALIVLMLPAAAPLAFVSSKTFFGDCTNPANPIQQAECRGYILAIADAINSNVVKGKRVCFPESAEQDEVRERVMQWVRTNAHLVQRMHGFGAVYAALIKTYPCRK
jgi:hypothetical protein